MLIIKKKAVLKVFTQNDMMIKQAMIHESNGDFEDALDLYKEIEKNYKTSREGNGIEKYISRAENLL